MDAEENAKKMRIERRLLRHLKRLNTSIQKLVGQSPEFAQLRKMLRQEKVELAIYVVPLLGGKPVRDELRFGLTEADRSFLKEAGIRF